MKVYSWSNFLMGIVLTAGVFFRLFNLDGGFDLILIPVLIYQAIQAFRISRTKKEPLLDNRSDSSSSIL